MKNFGFDFNAAAIGLLCAASVSAQTWSVKSDADTVSIMTEAVKSQSYRDLPTTLTITCAADILEMTPESACEATVRPSNNAFGFETNVLLTFEFVGGKSVLFDDSVVYPFQTVKAAQVLHLDTSYTADIVARMTLKPTFATSIDREGDGATLDENGQFARMVSHFDTSDSANTIKKSGMQCGIQEQLD